MDLLERAIYMGIGCFIGFVLGVIVTYLHEIKEELDEVDDILKKEEDDSGRVSRDTVHYIGFGLVILLCAFAAFQSQQASNKSDAFVAAKAQVTECNSRFLNKTILALNERTEFSQQQIQSNVSLQGAQATFFGLVIQKPPIPQEEAEAAAQKYFKELNDFLDISRKSRKQVAKNPFPTVAELKACFREENP